MEIINACERLQKFIHTMSFTIKNVTMTYITCNQMCFLKCLGTLLGRGTLPLDVPTSFFYHTTLTMHFLIEVLYHINSSNDQF